MMKWKNKYERGEERGNGCGTERISQKSSGGRLLLLYNADFARRRNHNKICQHVDSRAVIKKFSVHFFERITTHGAVRSDSASQALPQLYAVRSFVRLFVRSFVRYNPLSKSFVLCSCAFAQGGRSINQ